MKEIEEKYESNINSLKKTIKELNDKIDKLEKDIINKDNKIKELEGKNKKNEKKEEEINKEKEENNENNQAKEIYDNLIKDYEDLKEQFEKLRESKSDEIEKVNNKLIIELKKKEKQYIRENDKKDKKLNEQNLKIAELNDNIKRLNEKITNINKHRTELEDIILSQEDNIAEMNETINKNLLIIQNNISEMNKNEAYINQLLTTIKEQKIQIQNEKEAHLKKDREEIIRLRTENKKFKSMIEIQNEELKNNQNAHRNLQEKYLQLCSDKRYKPHQELLQQAKEMKIRKMERDKKNSVFIIRKEEIEKNPNLSYKLNLSAKVNKTRNNIISTPRNLKMNTNDDNKLPPINSSRHYHQLSNFSHNDVYSTENDEEKIKEFN